MKVICCKEETKLVTGKEVYPQIPNLHLNYYYLCEKCRAYVGCHKNTKKPLGTPADKELRQLRIKVHNVVDKLWKSEYLTRSEVYEMLSRKFKISKENCHIGMFNKKQCEDVIDFLAEEKGNKNEKANRK